LYETDVDERVRERFDLGRCLGSGTFGVVFEAREIARGVKVALKKLNLSDAASIYGFKQEFRALADVAHPNLVRLNELFSIDDQLYLSMELVEGENLLSYVREEVSPGAVTFADRYSLPSDPTLESDPEGPGSGPVHARRSAPRRSLHADVDRLRSTLRQVALGLFAIHRAKKLHRDLKPGNVLVTAEGRAVILDFGLVAGVGVQSSRRDRRVVGTPAYMSPEQAQGQPLGPASDWYSFGVMLYEALTGDLPIDGDVREILIGKQATDPLDPRALVAGLPDDLADLSMSLLRRDPRDRPRGAAVIRALGADPGAEPEMDVLPLVGREHHFAALEDAFQASRAVGAATVLVHGTSGMGKTALLRRFLDEMIETHDAVVLEGRCYERESVPYKALDPLIDGLTDHLGGLSQAEIEPLLPADLPALVRLFPVLRRVEALGAGPRSAAFPDLPEVRRRASAALRDLLGRLADAGPLVLCVDDLQWGDADSASLLLDLTAKPDPPALLLIAGYRSEDASSIDLVTALRRRMARGEPVGDVREVVIGPLSPRESRALARALLAGGSAAGEAPARDLVEERGDVDAIARESGGSPFFVHELTRHALASSGAAVSLEDVLVRRVERLPAPARALLEAIAAAGVPVASATARRAAAIEDDAGALAILRAQHLVKSRGGELEAFHDRIREAVVARLAPADLARYHLRLAEALVESPGADPETLMSHFADGGDAARARGYAEIAAARAAEALAFDRAAALYRRSLDGAPDRRPLLVQLGHALSHAGRGAEAARAYLEATAGASPAEALDLRRRAAEQFLRAGHVDEGLAAVREVLEAVDLSLPRTPARAFASLLYQRARLSIRGLGFEERAGEASADELTRIDVCWSVGNGLNGVDIVRGADFQARHLLYALSAGDPYRIARALSSEAIFASMEGGSAGRERAALLIERGAGIAERIRHPHALAWAAGARAGAAFYEQRLEDAVTLSDQAVALFRSTCTDITWELGSILGWWLLPALYLLGRLDELGRRLPACLKEAEDLGALYNATSFRTYTLPKVLFAQDRPADARREAAAAIAGWSHQGWHTHHLSNLFTQSYAWLYEGEPARALAEVNAGWPQLKRSLLLRVEVVRVEALYLRGTAAVATAVSGSDSTALLRAAERDARALEGEEKPWGRALGRALRAAIAMSRGDADRAAALYGEAASAFDGLSMALYAAAMRRRKGEIVLGEEGRALVEGADGWMRRLGVVRPERVSAMLAPPGG
jgi:serine/threonine protein kinase/tetratricopeptide (TPR) repeat protein